MKSVTIVGPGRMGLALAEALARSGELNEVSVFGRRPEPPRHPAFALEEVRYVYGVEPITAGCMAVMLAVPDAAVPEVAHEVAAQGPAPDGSVAFHLSGALPTDVLAPLHASGYQVGAFHPWIMASASATGADRLRGARVATTASPEGFRVARELSSYMGAEVMEIPAARRVVAHAAVSMVEGYLPVLVGTAIPLLNRVGLSDDEATEALVPLLRSVLMELEGRGADEVLRDISQRLDPETVDIHMRSLDGAEGRLYAWLREIASGRSGGQDDVTGRGSEHQTVSRE